VRRNNPTEPKLHWFFNKLLQNGDVFVDVGANAGFISLLASERVGKEGKVIAVEPNPRIAYFTHYTLANNARNKNHILLQVALSDQSCLLPISMSSSDSILMERASIVYKEKASEEVEVLCSTLDIILPTDLKPTVVKIDVEGAELQVLRGAVSVLRKYRPVVSVEVHGLYFDDPYAHAKSITLVPWTMLSLI
jgi:FkbM family methyltransferase